MKVLFIGGTGIISTTVSRQAIAAGFDLYLLNRGIRGTAPPGSHSITADINQPDKLRAGLQGLQFEVVVNWIAYTPQDIERDLALFKDVGHYIFVSSASVYQKPPAHYLITEETPLANPFWDYSRNKIACEDRLLRAFSEEGFPATIVRPSLTYDANFPVAIGSAGYTIADRMKKGWPIIVHGDGTSLWVVTHAEDFGWGFLGLLGNPRTFGQAFHITTDEVLTWNEIYRTIAGELRVEANLVHIPSDFIARTEPDWAGTLLGDKTWSAVFDNTKIKTFVPEFEAIIPFQEGIQRTIRWFEDERRRSVDQAEQVKMDRILSAYGERSAGVLI
ncbi:MAG: NAD-dependent epimerase/dehydratase family protein [Pyrinomonadaceae bacterium]|nr:NAD-dependent epimerase/dehydratase family protein [Pyrinomonadaceae bacterium]